MQVVQNRKLPDDFVCFCSMARPLVEHQLALDVRAFRRRGAIPWDHDMSTGFWIWRNPLTREQVGSIGYTAIRTRMRLAYACGKGDSRRDIAQVIRLEWTPCTYGGSRPWFLCDPCDRRVAILYLTDHGVFACRKCIGAAYSCQREGFMDRMFRKRERFRARLRAEPGSELLSKPKGMHWRTFMDLEDQAYHAELAGLDAAVRRFCKW